jgi:hypothetical protein
MDAEAEKEAEKKIDSNLLGKFRLIIGGFIFENKEIINDQDNLLMRGLIEFKKFNKNEKG